MRKSCSGYAPIPPRPRFHKSLRTDNFRISWNSEDYYLIRDVLRFSNDTGTIVLRIFAGFDRVRLESHEYC